MANADTPMGLKPVKYLNGSPWNGQARVYYVPDSDSTAIFMHDPVSLAGSADTLGKYATVAQSAATGAIVGVVVGFGNTPYVAFDATNLERKYRPASTAMYLWVVDDPNVLFIAQEDSDTSSLDADAVGTNCDIVVGSGDTTTGLSAVEIDSSDTKSATAQLRIHGLADMDNNAIGTNACWYVSINEHQLKSTTGA
jgi:hypothetical protein